MNKKFWLIIISFWFACIIAGLCTYYYIFYSQKLEREQYVSEFKYENIIDIQVESITSPTIQYDAEPFLNEIQHVLETMNQHEEKISTIIHNNDNLNSNLDYILTAYQQSKFLRKKFTNTEITNSSLHKKKQLEKIADATVNYIEASSMYYIISAKKLKQSTPFLEQQYKTVHNSLSTSKSHLFDVIGSYAENE